MTLHLIEPGARWALHNQDCTAALPGLPGFAVDHTIMDPPYEADVHTKGRRICAGSFALRASGQDTTIIKPIAYPPITEIERREIARHIARVTRRWILVFCQVEAAMLWRAALEAGGAEYVRTGSWHKTDAQPQLSGDRPGQGWEAIVICHGARAAGGTTADLPLLGDMAQPHAGRMRWNGGGQCAKWSGASRNHGGNLSRRKLIDGQKPDWLMERLITMFTDPCDLVADFCAGSGSTGVAALRHGRRFVGFERTESTYEIARARLLEAAAESEVRGDEHAQLALGGVS